MNKEELDKCTNLIFHIGLAFGIVIGVVIMIVINSL